MEGNSITSLSSGFECGWVWMNCETFFIISIVVVVDVVECEMQCVALTRKCRIENLLKCWNWSFMPWQVRKRHLYCRLSVAYNRWHQSKNVKSFAKASLFTDDNFPRVAMLLTRSFHCHLFYHSLEKFPHSLPRISGGSTWKQHHPETSDSDHFYSEKKSFCCCLCHETSSSSSWVFTFHFHIGIIWYEFCT